MVFYASSYEIERINSGEGFAGLFSTEKEGKYKYRVAIDELSNCFSCDADFVAEGKNKLPQGDFCDNCIINPADKRNAKQGSEIIHGEYVTDRIIEALEYLDGRSISNVAIIMIDSGGDVMDCWANKGDPFALVGALESLKFDFMRSSIEYK